MTLGFQAVGTAISAQDSGGVGGLQSKAVEERAGIGPLPAGAVAHLAADGEFGPGGGDGASTSSTAGFA